MLVKFKNMDELVEYLSSVEQRLAALEAENSQLRSMAPARATVDESHVPDYLARALPKTNLFHPSFLKRAFAVWGHFVVANIIVGFGAGLVYLCFLGVILAFVSQNGGK